MKSKAKKVQFLSILILPIVAIALIVFVIIRNRKPTTIKTEEHSRKLILGFSQIGSESAWRTRNTESIFEAAAENDIQLILHDAQQKQENQLKAIRSFIVYQVDVIAFVPIVEDGWDNVLTEAKEAGIPVIVVDRQINADPSLYAGILGENGYEEGRRAARFLLNKCRNRTDTVTIFEMSGTENSSIVKDRARGFRDIINTDPKFKIIHTESGDFLRSRGKEICDVLLANNVRVNGNTTNTLYFDGQKIDAVFSHNDAMMLGFLDSLTAHKVNAKDTVFVSIDAEQESIDALKSGKLNCVVECNPNLGPMLMKLVKQLAEGNPIPILTYTDETVFTEDDDFSLYEPRGY